MLHRTGVPVKVGAESKIQVYQLRHDMTWEAVCNHCRLRRVPWFATGPRYENIWRRVVAHARMYHGVRLDG